jgi:hypothetical protein
VGALFLVCLPLVLLMRGRQAPGERLAISE